MLQISTLQMQALDQAQVQRFVPVVSAHIAAFAPQVSASMGPDRLRESVATGLCRAVRYGFDQLGSARFYVELMFMFGHDFDTDPQYPWIGKLLSQTGAPGGLDRADTLHVSVIEFVNEVSGPRHCHEAAALRRVAQAHMENVIAPNVCPSDVMESLAAIYPEKCRAVGNAALTVLVNEAFSRCERMGPAWADGRQLVACLMFVFGHGCLADPQYPWIAGTLPGSALSSGGFERLFNKSVTYFEHAQQRLQALA